MMSGRRVLLVLGMHRSGTSAFTAGLGALGVDLGQKLLGPAADNEKGFFEHLPAYKLNEELLASFHRDWSSIGDFNIADHPRFEVFLGQAIRMILRDFPASQVFALKDPRISRLLPFWREVFRRLDINVIPILVLRQPMAVAKSLATRERFSITRSLIMWARHSLGVLENFDEIPLIVNYERLVDKPEECLWAIRQQFNLKCGAGQVGAFGTSADEATALGSAAHAEGADLGDEVKCRERIKQFATEFIDPDLQHAKVRMSAAIPAGDNSRLRKGCSDLFEELTKYHLQSVKSRTFNSAVSPIRELLRDQEDFLSEVDSLKIEADSLKSDSLRVAKAALIAQVDVLQDRVRHLEDVIHTHQKENTRTLFRSARLAHQFIDRHHSLKHFFAAILSVVRYF
ncbi:MAG: hypothetical protein C5B49_15100 [Bdellovibrio sp.]|nr:MAG: hypothetical protein C5B49_15100 [Bdellovibrio sp.]